ncbi:hypothetical protein R69888_01513 [Paraburkholderia haematera]|uniref:Uncharacterized protein n=1 Tax=Paraburkholderia haematera TaxID=2793077 RepID=A0ABM8QWH5_9BURK|nr:hypothetical protein R69888_01513 [Paraburkholderia haematera]
MRADVAFFKYMYMQAIFSRNGMHVAMNFAAIAKHYDVGKAARLYSIDIPISQFACLSTEIPCITISGVCQIATAEINSTYSMATLAQCNGKPAKERGSRALQGEKGTVHVRTSKSGPGATNRTPNPCALPPETSESFE